VSLLGTTDVPGEPKPEAEVGPSSRVQAVVDVFGPADLTQDFSKQKFGNWTVQDLVDRFLGKGNVEAQKAASPQLHIDDRTAAFLIFQGTDDPLVPLSQSQNFDAALRKAGRESELVVFQGEGHGFKAASRKVLIEKSIAFFDRHLKGDHKAAKEGGGNAAQTEKKTEAKPAPVDWGALFKMHWVNRTKTFREQNEVFKNVVLVGDSITEGFDVATFFPGRRVINRGIGADVIGNDMPADDPRGVLRRLDESVFDCAPTDVFLLIGINDLNTGRKPGQLEAGYKELFRKLKEGAPRVRVHVQSVLPTRGDHAKRNPDVLVVNETLRRLSKEAGFDYIDLHLLMKDENGELKAEFTNDGLHLTPPAYAVWRGAVEKAMGWDGEAPASK
jgi:lysophospholipase L1-like esterase